MAKRFSYILLCMFCVIISQQSYAQGKPHYLYKVFRVNLLNPGMEYEYPLDQKTTVSINPGAGIVYSFDFMRNIRNFQNPYSSALFLDLQYKSYYNLHKRMLHNKKTDNNSGSFLGFRILVQAETISFTRADENLFGFSAGPVWGFQRTFNDMHLLVAGGPALFFDSEAEAGFFPIMIDLNFGFDFYEEVCKMPNKQKRRPKR